MTGVGRQVGCQTGENIGSRHARSYVASLRERERESSVCYCACSEDPVKKKSQGSLESSSRSEEDEGSDSLGVYEDVDPTKFNDEGSFIDQSGFKHVLQASTPDGTAVPPTAV